MIPPLAGLEPQGIWKHFSELTCIPRKSGNEAAARQYVLDLATRLGLDETTDRVGNVVIRKPAHRGRETAPVTVLQGHLDMVCEKNEGTAHNFASDAISVVRDGDWIKAKGTTLGADNGIGVAAALAVMESQDIAHGPLEFVFTVDEETGLTGASEFPAGVLKATYFFNLDNEEQGTLCIGCSGGVKTIARRRVNCQTPTAGACWRIKVSGLHGGHSGIDIHKGRGNALRLLGRVLQRVMERVPLAIAQVEGGTASNAIPREAFALVVADTLFSEQLQSIVAAAENDMRAELGGFDPGLTIAVEECGVPSKVLDRTDASAVIGLLTCLPHGVLDMSPDIAGLVQTSTNLAMVATKGPQVEIQTSQRSAIRSSIQAASGMVGAICRLAGCEVENTGEYPGWKPDPNSEVARKLQAVYRELFSQPVKLIAMHAGLECGVIGEKYPGMQMVSFGPTVVDPHSPNERLQISSVESFWKFLKSSLERV